MTIRNGWRCSASTAYLRPALGRANLNVFVNTLATRIVFDGRRAVGIEYLRNGERGVVQAEREVLLAGGVINSPQLLMLSGVGDPAELSAHSIDIRAPLPGVGKNLQDHISASVEYRRRGPGPFCRTMRLDRIGIELAKAALFGTGFACDLPSGWTAFIKSRAGRSAAGHPANLSCDTARRRAVSAAVQASLLGWVWMPCDLAAAEEPG